LLHQVGICMPLPTGTSHPVAHPGDKGAIYVTISADLDENPSIQANPADKAFA